MEISSLVVAVLMTLTGGMSLAFSVSNPEWFFRNRNVLCFVRCFGRTGARIFYGLLGVGMIAMGITIICQSV